MSFDRNEAPHEEDLAFVLDERKLAALSVIDAAVEACWLTEEEAEGALFNSELRGEIALTIDIRLQKYGAGRNGGAWDSLVARLDRAFVDYVAHNQDQLGHERRSMQLKPHAFWAPQGMVRCAWCLEKEGAQVHAEERRNAACADGGPSSDLGLSVTK